MAHGRHWLSPTVQCEAPHILCGFAQTTKTYNEALLAAIHHNKETGHLVRVEEIHTQLIGWEDDSNWNKDINS